MGFSLGVVLTLLISPPPQLKSLDFDLPKPVLRMAESLGDVELMKYLPEGVQDVIGKWSIPSFKSEEEYEDFIPGARLAAQGLVAKVRRERSEGLEQSQKGMFGTGSYVNDEGADVVLQKRVSVHPRQVVLLHPQIERTTFQYDALPTEQRKLSWRRIPTR